MVTMNKHSSLQATGAVATVAPNAMRPSVLSPPDPIWRAIRDEALAAIDKDRRAAVLYERHVLEQASLAEAVVSVLAYRLGDDMVPTEALAGSLGDCLGDDAGLVRYLAADFEAVYDRDPACQRYIEPLMFFKGFHALQAQRFAHCLWMTGRKDMALFLQSRSSAVFQVDIHPATRIGGGVFLDHATGIVVGETAVIDDNVSLLQGVTLGGTGKETGDRHPKVRCGVLVGAGAKVLGNIELGKGSRVAASSVVLDAVPEGATVAGIPAKVVSIAPSIGEDCMPSMSMDHHMDGEVPPADALTDPGAGI